jgi:hypothetical protein
LSESILTFIKVSENQEAFATRIVVVLRIKATLRQPFPPPVLFDVTCMSGTFFSISYNDLLRYQPTNTPPPQNDSKQLDWLMCNTIGDTKPSGLVQVS